MEIINVGRFVVQIELDRVDGPLKYYDVVLCKDNKEVKICKGCIGEKSATFWGNHLEKLAKKLEILYTKKELVAHNILCYSETCLMSEPKVNFNFEWQEAKEELEFIETWIQELESKI